MIRLLTFDTTHHALWAEEVALANGFGVEVVPAPAEAEAKCDLALEFLAEEENSLVGALRAEGITFRVYVGR